MDLILMNEEFEMVDIIDTFDSFIWVDRFYECGDLEIYLSPEDNKYVINGTGSSTSGQTDKPLKIGYYIQNPESDKLMIIETFQSTTDMEKGSQLVIKGHSLEYILSRRIVWKQTILDGYLQGQIEKLFNENVINPEIPERRIPNFVFKYSNDPRITELRISAQYTGDNLYDVIYGICKYFKIGFKVTFNETNHTFVFEFYSGTDRSYNQTENAYVIFSPNFDNVITSEYIESESLIKNVALVAGEGEGAARTKCIIGDLEVSGLNRKELYVDARDLSSDLEDGSVMPEEQYAQQLANRGLAKLAENQITTSFNSNVDSNQMYTYKKDYFLGDIIQFEDKFGITESPRITEYIYSQDANGVDFYPTFEVEEEVG